MDIQDRRDLRLRQVAVLAQIADTHSLVVASIPDIEIGGDAGKIALETIEHTFERMESIWTPVVICSP
jgi:hypothetical protein